MRRDRQWTCLVCGETVRYASAPGHLSRTDHEVAPGSPEYRELLTAGLDEDARHDPANLPGAQPPPGTEPEPAEEPGLAGVALGALGAVASVASDAGNGPTQAASGPERFPDWLVPILTLGLVFLVLRAWDDWVLREQEPIH